MKTLMKDVKNIQMAILLIAQEISIRHTDSPVMTEIEKTIGIPLQALDADPNLVVKQYSNDKLWVEICDTSFSTYNGLSITLVGLRKLLEEHKILGDEKDGM